MLLAIQLLVGTAVLVAAEMYGRHVVWTREHYFPEAAKTQFGHAVGKWERGISLRIPAYLVIYVIAAIVIWCLSSLPMAGQTLGAPFRIILWPFQAFHGL